MSDNFLDINLFEKSERIGKGSFGEVFKIKRKGTEENYAAKISYATIDGNVDQELHNLLREVNINSKINHPSILKFIGFSRFDFNHEPKPVIITEYCKNESLSQIIDLERKSRALLDDTRKLLTIYGIAAGMSFLHEHDILHRDLKPANILIDDYFLPKIADFGLSKQIHKKDETMSLQSTPGVKGTPVYISPEIYESCNYTKAADVYAFAFIMYEILTNEEPFKKLSPFQICNEVLKGHRPDFKFPINQAYKDLIERCWTQDMNDRPNFDSIVDELKNNPDFIAESIDEDVFHEYINYIDNCKGTFDDTKQIIKADDFIKKSKSKLFIKFDIRNYLENAKNFIYSHVVKWLPKQENLYFPIGELHKLEENRKQIVGDAKNFIYSHAVKWLPKQENLYFPIDEFNELDDECKQLVEDAKNDIQKQFDLGKALIEGDLKFKQNVQIGVKYLEKSSSAGCIESAIYLSQMLIKSDLIPCDLDKAKKHLYKFLNKDDSRVLFLYAKILKKQKKQKDARYYFEKGANKNHPQSMYEYAKMLFLGVGGSLNEQEAEYQLFFSKNNFEKSDKYFNALNKMKENKSFKKLHQEAKHFFIKQIIKYNIDLKCKTIKIDSNQIEFLFNNSSFSSLDFIDVLQLFESVSIEIKYPSDLYDKILHQVINIKEDFISEMKICICISDFQNDEHKFGPNKFINSFDFSSDIQSIPKDMFYKCSSITSISIPSSVATINEGAFKNCSSLSKVSFGEKSSLLDIQSHAFSHCSSLKQIELPSSIIKIGESAFDNCSALEQITIPKSVSEIESYAFRGCVSITQVVISSSLTKISQGTFEECMSLYEISIPSSVKKICCGAFKDCKSLNKIFIPNSVAQIESFVFCGCSSLKEIILPSILTYLGCSAFKDCKSLQQISIPSSIASIDEHTFDGCVLLKSVSIPLGVTSIGYYAFANCESLSELAIPDSVNSIGKFAFYCCSSLKQVSISSVKEIRESVFEGCSSLTKISVPPLITSIGKNAFKGCSSLTEFPIPFSIEEAQLEKI